MAQVLDSSSAALTAPLLPTQSDGLAIAGEDDIRFARGPRSYRVRGLARCLSAEALKVTLRLSAGERLHLDPNNQENVTCHSDGEGRYLSARQDFLKWKLDTRPTQYAGQGEVLKISYKGGGDERYIWIPRTVASPTAPAELMLARVPGTLNCP